MYARASLTAAFMTSEPFLANFTMSPPTICEQGLGRLQFEDRRSAEVRSQPHLPGRRVVHRGEGVAERHGAQAHAVFDELVAVDVPHPTALPAHEDRQRVGGILIVALGVGVRAAGNEAVQTLGQRQRAVEARFVRPGACHDAIIHHKHYVATRSRVKSTGNGRQGLTHLRSNRTQAVLVARRLRAQRERAHPAQRSRASPAPPATRRRGLGTGQRLHRLDERRGPRRARRCFPISVLAEIDVADKANAWNVYVHELITPERAREIETYFFMDGDVTLEPDALVLLAAALSEVPSAKAAGGMPAFGPRSGSSWRERMVRNGMLAGNLYALRSSFVDCTARAADPHARGPGVRGFSCCPGWSRRSSGSRRLWMTTLNASSV